MCAKSQVVHNNKQISAVTYWLSSLYSHLIRWNLDNTIQLHLSQVYVVILVLVTLALVMLDPEIKC